MLIQTTKGELNEDVLVKKTGKDENENEIAEWVEYWHDGELVHRSVHVSLKRWPAGMGGLGEFMFGKQEE